MEDNKETTLDAELESRQYVCPTCGKVFKLPLYVLPSTYVYSVLVYDKGKKRTHKEKCCSYSCYRRYSQK